MNRGECSNAEILLIYSSNIILHFLHATKTHSIRNTIVVTVSLPNVTEAAANCESLNVITTTPSSLQTVKV